MDINIQAPWEVNQYLEGVIHEKVQKLDTYFNGIIHANVFLKLNGSGATRDKIAEIRLSLPGPYLFAEETADTYEGAVTLAAEKIKKQLIKKKELLKEQEKLRIR